ncbi:Nmad4 family putative nucleotide modification protein [Trueperella pyogenes]|uniref:Nmad4 family putative nucleotide modification protein n=1 Tax=Trueperella pyogenes TaxID=1661 RepID=UPI000D52BA48|nr:hypothetical protein [Trueperella pyogenes]AWG03418.1 hypothetical protein DC090_02590 [Trueperella pyogenes]AWG16149.1 hypothetical protein DDE06_04515 [Trueperella pyogenes]AZR05032.1 hypothetical protein EBQ11_07120 [Trueperella pyogenes]
MFTTLEKIQMEHPIAMRHGNRVIVAAHTWKKDQGLGVQGRIYEFIDEPSVEFSALECRLELVAESDELFTDEGTAIAWTMNN